MQAPTNRSDELGNGNWGLGPSVVLLNMEHGNPWVYGALVNDIWSLTNDQQGWWVTDEPRLSAAARAAIGDESNAVFVSAATAWEIATKHRLGKLGEAAGAVARFAELVAADGFEHLPASYLHALKASGSASAHRDPFDRMLAALSALEGLPLVTRDPAFKAFGIQTLW